MKQYILAGLCESFWRATVMAWVFVLITISLPLGCKKEPQQLQTEEPKSGKRDYVWSIDTLWFLGAEQIIGKGIYASSANSAWVSAISNTSRGSLWHFDGTQWLNPPNPADASDGRGSVDLNGVFGLSSNSVWFFGFRIRSVGLGQTVTSGFAMEWSGSHYVEYTDTLISKGEELMAAWGDSRDRLFFVGKDGTFLRFDGTQWHKSETGTRAWLNAIWGTNGNDVLVLGYELDAVQPFDSTYYSVASWNGTQFSIVSTFLETGGSSIHPWGVNALWSDNSKFYSSDYSLFVRTGMGWNKLLDSPFVLRTVRGSGPHDVFAVGNRNTFLHFNGVDWRQLSPVLGNDVHWNALYATGKEVFAVGESGSKAIVLRGK